MSGGEGKRVRLIVRAAKFITLALACLLGIGISFGFGLEGATTDPSVSLTIYPSDDAFVSSMFPDNTSVRVEDYVDIWDLWVGREWISALSVVRVNRAFLKFDLSSIPAGAEITSARLRLYRAGLALQTETTGAPMVQCYAAGDDWDENTITWNTQPSVGTYLDSYENVVFWNSWDVASFTQQELLRDRIVSFMLRAEDEVTQETSSAIFPSKEYDSYDPRLEITYTYVPLQRKSIPPSDDAHVTERHPDTNYGDKTSLQLRSGAKGLKNERIFLKFDLSALPAGATILEARLYLYSWWGRVDLDAQSRGVENDDWSEDTITWNNQPSYGGVLDTVTLTREARNNWSSWDVTSFVENEFTGDRVASFCLRAAVEDAKGWYRFRSREYDNVAARPYLEVAYTT
jgi:hypothetical protein